MELQPAFTLKLMLNDFPPESFSYADIQEELMEPSGIYRSYLLFGSFMAVYDLIVSDGVIHSDDHIVQLIGKNLAEIDLKVQWKVIDGLKSDA